MLHTASDDNCSKVSFGVCVRLQARPVHPEECWAPKNALNYFLKSTSVLDQHWALRSAHTSRMRCRVEAHRLRHQGTGMRPYCSHWAGAASRLLAATYFATAAASARRFASTVPASGVFGLCDREALETLLSSYAKLCMT